MYASCLEKMRQVDSWRKPQTSAFPRMAVVVKRWEYETRYYGAVVRVQGAHKLQSVDFFSPEVVTVQKQFLFGVSEILDF